MESRFNLDSRGKRSDSLGSLDSDSLVANDGEKHGWRKIRSTPVAITTSRFRIKSDTIQRGTPEDKSCQLDQETGDSNQVDIVEDGQFSSDDGSAIVYETDLLGLAHSLSRESHDKMDPNSPPEEKSLKREEFYNNELSDINGLSWSGRIGDRMCSVYPIQNFEISSDDESIQYEADLEEYTSNNFTDQTIERKSSLAGDGSSPPRIRSNSESMSSDDDFNDADDSFPVLKGLHAQSIARNFAMEHRIFIKCLMTLLEQRDMVAIDMDDPNTLKCGPLKKATQLVKGAWKVKYVEVRRGMFSYYDDCLSKDAGSEGSLVRKNVHLDASNCVCRAVKLNHKSLILVPGQAIFELTVDGSPRRFWMANSREERSAWIRAIHNSMVGGSVRRDEQQMDHVGRVGKVSRRSPYKRDLEIYLRVQREVRNASNKASYVGALVNLLGQPLNVPVKWISDHNHLNTDETEKAFREDGLATEVNQLWKDLARDAVQINSTLIKGGSGHAPERIVGAVTREILRMDKSSPLRPQDPSFIWNGITELQALSFARDILLSCNRTRSGGDSYYCVDALTSNPGMVVLVPSSMEAEPLSIEIKHYQEQDRIDRPSYSVHDRGGWLKTRTRLEPEWKVLYFVLSEGTLSIYKKGHPRPYGLEAQVKIAETPMYVAPAIRQKSVDDDNKHRKRRFLLTFKGREGIMERQIFFESEDKFLTWVYAFEEEVAKHEMIDSPRRNLKFFQMLSPRDESKGDDRIGFVIVANSLEDNAAELGFEPGLIINRAKALALQHRGGPKVPTVAVQVRASTTYKICTLNPQGDESEDTWASVRATFLQHFGIVGGPNGLMNRSEEVVQINFLDCSSNHLAYQWPLPEPGVSPRTLAGTISRKLRRRDSQPEATQTLDRTNALQLKMTDL